MAINPYTYSDEWCFHLIRELAVGMVEFFCTFKNRLKEADDLFRAKGSVDIELVEEVLHVTVEEFVQNFGHFLDNTNN